MQYLGVAVLGVAVLGTAVLGAAVLGTAVLGVAVLGTAVLHPHTRSLSTQHSLLPLFPHSIPNHGVAWIIAMVKQHAIPWCGRAGHRRARDRRAGRRCAWDRRAARAHEITLNTALALATLPTKASQSTESNR